jgi:uncharacterized protein (TIGR02679 family)
LDECVKFFKETEGFARLMDGMLDSYIRHERCYGAVRLSRPTPGEEQAISDFFKRDYYDQALIRIGLADFERQTQKNFSIDVTLEAILELYFNRKITRKSRSHNRNGSAFTKYVESVMIPRYGSTDAALWLREPSAHTRRGYRKLAEDYLINPDGVIAALETVCGALNDIPETENAVGGARVPATPLGEFSYKHTGDRHAFEAGGKTGQLFLRALAWKFDADFPVSPEEYAALYFKAGLIAEGIMSHVAVFGLLAFRGDVPDEPCAAYGKHGEAYLLTLENINHFSRVRAQGGKVFVVENMSVFSALCERVRECGCTVVCNAGGLSPAAALLLDMLHGGGAAVYYSGNMDYPGLCLADRIYLRYPKRFVPWRLTKSDYDNAEPGADFYEANRQKEEGLHNEDLAALLSYMRKKGKTAEQSALVNALAEDIKNFSREG